MIEQSFSIHHLEYYLAILVRVLGAVAYAPIFGNATVTRRARLILGLAISYAMVTANPYIPLEYTSFIGYTVILLRELMVGLTLGFTTSIALTIINMAGQFIDREIGFSMVSNFDMTFNTETTITAEFYSMSVMLIMLCTNMHYFILSALSDSFEMIPVGQVVIDTGALYDTMVEYIAGYFMIAIRIALPVMISIMLLNMVLGILAKTAPQMNMFAIGLQLKIFVGFAVMFATLAFLPNITEFVYHQMQEVVVDVLQSFVT